MINLFKIDNNHDSRESTNNIKRILKRKFFGIIVDEKIDYVLNTTHI